ncbi:MAG: autotransporter-associated beta strand repeat-containing protein, partial [Luteolibacter sp.]
NGVISNGSSTVGIIKNGTGTLTINNAANSYTGTTSVVGGVLALGTLGTISNTLSLGTSTPTVASFDVTSKTAYTQANVSGNGTLNIGAGKTFTVSGNLGPGFSPGTINVTGDLGLTASTITTMELAGLGGVAGTDSDFVSVSGTIALDGMLIITGFNGFDITQASTYHLFDAASFTGDLDGVSVGGNALSFESDIWSGSFGATTYSFSENSGVLSVIPEPGAVLLGSMGMLALLRRRRA